MPDYWHPRLAEVLAGPHRDEWRLSAHHDDLPDDRLDLPISRLQVTYDDNRAPYVQLRADVVAPSDPALDAILDPRLGVRLHAHYGVECRRDESPSSVAGRTNASVNPRGRNGVTGWNNNNGAWGAHTKGVAITDHPQGIDTAVRYNPVAAAPFILSLYDVDGLANAVVSRSLGVWVWSSVPASARPYLGGDQVGTGHTTLVPANTWTWCRTAGASTGYAILNVSRQSGAVAGTEVVYATGSLASVGLSSPAAPWFDGGRPGVTPRFGGATYAWTGPAYASSSVETIHTPGPVVAEPTLLADLALRLRGSILPTRVVALDASSDESLVIDNAPSSVLTGLASNSSRGHIQSVITTALGAAPAFVVNAPSDAAFTVPAGASTDKWDTVQDMADGLGDIRVFDDGYRTWWLDPQPVLAADADLALVDGVNGTVVVRDSQVDREPWYNRVVLVYRWTSGGVENIIQSVRSITSGPYQATAGNTKAYREERSTAATQARADQAATSMVRRKSTLGRGLRVRCVAVPWFRPGLTVSITDATGTARHLAASVVFDRAGYMEFTTRYADSTETIGA